MRLFLIVVFSVGCSLFTQYAVAQESSQPAPTFIEASELNLQAQLPRWPADESLGGRADLDAVLAFQAMRTTEQERLANDDAPRGPVEWAQLILGPNFTPSRFPVTTDLLVRAHDDMRLINRAANIVHGLRERPMVRDSQVKPSLPNAGGADNPSYPSARTAGSLIWANILSEVFPDRRDALVAAAEKTAWYRLVGGSHYPTDLEGGRAVATSAWSAFLRDSLFTERLSEARREGQAQQRYLSPQ
jgi:acid phosphatase (class A)